MSEMLEQLSVYMERYRLARFKQRTGAPSWGELIDVLSEFAATLPSDDQAGGAEETITIAEHNIAAQRAYERGRRDEREACIAEVEAHLNFAQNAGDFDGKESELRTTSYLLNRIRQRSRNGGENE